MSFLKIRAPSVVRPAHIAALVFLLIGLLWWCVGYPVLGGREHAAGNPPSGENNSRATSSESDPTGPAVTRKGIRPAAQPRPSTYDVAEKVGRLHRLSGYCDHDGNLTPAARQDLALTDSEFEAAQSLIRALWKDMAKWTAGHLAYDEAATATAAASATAGEGTRVYRIESMPPDQRNAALRRFGKSLTDAIPAAAARDLTDAMDTVPTFGFMGRSELTIHILPTGRYQRAWFFYNHPEHAAEYNDYTDDVSTLTGNYGDTFQSLNTSR